MGNTLKVIYNITVFLLLLSISVDASLIKPKLIWEKTFSSQIMKVCERKDIDMLKGQKAKFPLSAVITKKDVLLFNLRGKEINKISLQGYDKSSISNDGTIIAAMKGRELTVLSSHNEIINKIKIAEPQPVVLPQYITFEVSPNGQYIVIISWFSKQIYFYAVNGKLLARHQFKDLRKSRVLFSKDSSTVLIHVPNFGDGSSHGFLTCFNKTGKLLWRFDHDGCEAEFDVSENTFALLTSKHLYALDRRGKILFKKDLPNHKLLSISNRSTHIASTSKNSIYFWSYKKNNLMWQYSDSNFDQVNSLSSVLTISDNSQFIVYSSFQNWRDKPIVSNLSILDNKGNKVYQNGFDNFRIENCLFYNSENYFCLYSNISIYLYDISL